MSLRDRFRIAPLLTGFFVLGLLGSISAKEQHALLIAISDYPDVPGRDADLPACVHDAAAVKHWLQTQYGFPEANIREHYNQAATTEQITTSLEELVEVVKPGDAVKIYYSGHGTQVMDANGDETDRKDEALATWDMVEDISKGIRDPEHWLTDDVICHYLSRLQTNRVLVFFDCCHSGTGTRSFGDYFTPGPRKVGEEEEVRVKFLPSGFFWNLDRSKPKPQPKPDAELLTANGLHTLVAACRAEEQALAMQSMSLMTRLFLADAATSHAQVPIGDLGIRTTRQVSQAVNKYRAAQPSISTQTPEFEGNLKWSLDQLLSATPVTNDARTFAAPKVDLESVPTPEEAKRMAWGEIEVRVTTTKSRYVEGETMEVTVDSNSDGYLRLYYIDAAGATHLLFPNDASSSNRIQAGKPFRIPDSEGYELEMTAPFGQEVLKAVVSSTPFPDKAPIAEESLGELSLPDLGTRGIRVKVNQKVGEALTFYQVIGREEAPTKGS